MEHALGQIESAPKQHQSYMKASQHLAQAAAQARMDQAVQSAEMDQPVRPGSPGMDQSLSSPGGDGSGQLAGGDPGDLSAFEQAQAGQDQADWARLNERIRRAIRSEGVEAFTEEHQEAIRAYFKRLGEEQ